MQLWNGASSGERWICIESLERRRLFTASVDIAPFTGTNGTSPYGELAVDAEGNHYGITALGGDLLAGNKVGYGTVFEIPAGTNKIVTRATVSNNNADLQTVTGMVSDPAGDFYFSTGAGTDLNASNTFNIPGAIYELAAGANTISQVHIFANDNGEYPTLSGIYRNGTIYGTTAQNGPNLGGTVFEINTGTLAFKTLKAFDTVVEAPLIADASGNLYGSTQATASVFEIAATTHKFSTLKSFDLSPDLDVDVSNLVTDPDGDLFATLYTHVDESQEAGTSSLFELAAGTRMFSTIATGTDTNEWFGDLYSDAAGDIYGINGAYEKTTVFEIAAGTKKLQTLANFSDHSGAYVQPSLVFDAAGNIYGMTTSSRSDTQGDGGSIFEISATRHKLTTLTTFDGVTHGDADSLFANPDGHLHGILSDVDITNGDGAIFDITGLATDPAPARLIFAQEPTSTVAGKTIKPAVVIDIDNGSGNIIKTDDSPVTLAIATGSGTFTKTTVFTVKAVHGVATFNDIQLSLADHYILEGDQIGAASAFSQTIIITAPTATSGA